MFKYQGRIINVKISDNDFINKVNDRIYAFAKGDLIYGDLNLIEKTVPERYELLKVTDEKIKFKIRWPKRYSPYIHKVCKIAK